MMATRRLTMALCLAIAAPLSARATGCADAATQTDLNICAAEALKASDAALNATYRQVMGRLKTDPAKRALLMNAQKAWLAFRDAECDFDGSDVVGGSIHPMIVSECVDALTQSRTHQLEAYLHCAEGDMSCPVPAP